MVGSNILSLKSMLPSVQNIQLASRATYVGIDFGTSTTVVSIATKEHGDDKIRTLPIKLTQILEDGTIYQSEKLPSVIAWFNGRLLVGEGASNFKYKCVKNGFGGRQFIHIDNIQDGSRCFFINRYNRFRC